MAESGSIQFKDGSAYERYMGRWSRLAGESFLLWLGAKPGLRWLDVGCGNGAFTELLVERCAPASVEGMDPSEEQLGFARSRPALRDAAFRKGDAMAQPYPDDEFDVAVMPLVIFFLTDPGKGVAEMARIVRPGGTVAAYSWDMKGGGFPYAILQEEMRALDVEPLKPPSPEASRLDVLQALWSSAGLRDAETQAITVQRTFDGFEDFWGAVLGGPSVGAKLAAMDAVRTALLQERLRARLPRDASGRIAIGARANAVKGRVPA